MKIPTTRQDAHPQKLPVNDDNKEIKETESNSVKIKETQIKQIKESNRLSTKRLDNGTRICNTTACYEAGECTRT